MDDDGAHGLVGDGGWVGEVERAVLSDSPEGRAIAASFVTTFGDFVSGTVRPILRDVAAEGGEPQLLVNGLAEMLRNVADSMEFRVGDGAPSRPTAGGDAAPGTSDAP